MKTFKQKVVITTIIFLLFPMSISATPGGLKKASITTCNGVTYGSHSDDNHWHVAVRTSNGRYNASGDQLSGAPCVVNTPPPVQNEVRTPRTPAVNTERQQPKEQVEVVKEDPKSSDNTIKNIEVNGDEIKVEDKMLYSTTKEKATISIVLNDEKSKLDYKSEFDLDIGENILTYKVIAEDETEKVYTLTIEREKVLSSNNEINIFIAEELISFEDYAAEITIDTDSELTFELVDENAKTTLDSTINLSGDEKTFISFVVIAENGDIQAYSITVLSSSQLESESILGGSIIFSLILGGLLMKLFDRYKYKKKLK